MDFFDSTIPLSMRLSYINKAFKNVSEIINRLDIPKNLKEDVRTAIPYAIKKHKKNLKLGEYNLLRKVNKMMEI